MNIRPIGYHFTKTVCKLSIQSNRRNFVTSVLYMQKKGKERWTLKEEKWNRPKEEWTGFFHYFAPEKGITVDFVRALQKPLNFSPKALKAWYNKLQDTKAVIDQRYIEERVTALGCELAAAHFIVHRGGKILQKGSNEWIEKDKDEEYCLPRHFTPDFFVECIDASGTQLRYEGLECMGNLEYLKWLNLANCTFIDDWCVDRICGQYANSLEYLNLSNCTSISEWGFAALARLKKLKTLDVTGLHNINNVQLLCLLIEDVIPDINIIGINYMELPSSAGEQI